MTKADPTQKVSTVEWKTPPVATKYDWAEIAKKVRRRPMEWACIFENGRASKVNAIRGGKVPDLHPELGFETLTANNTRESPRTCDLFIRFNPNKVDPLREELRTSRKKK